MVTGQHVKKQACKEKMRSCRDIIEKFNSHRHNKTKVLNKIEPTKSLLIAPMPCEIKAAIIRNKTVDSIQENDVSDIAYRFLQCRRGETNTFKEAICWASYSIMMIALARRVPTIPLPIRVGFIANGVLHVPPNIRNSLTYRETKQSCDEWLTQRIGSAQVGYIKNLQFNQLGMFKLVDFLNRENIDITSLKGREKRKDEKFSCWKMDR